MDGMIWDNKHGLIDGFDKPRDMDKSNIYSIRLHGRVLFGSEIFLAGSIRLYEIRKEDFNREAREFIDSLFHNLDTPNLLIIEGLLVGKNATAKWMITYQFKMLNYKENGREKQ